MTNTADIDFDVHIEKLHVQLRDTQQAFKALLDDVTLDELIPIWEQPGWTTPAEYFFVSRSLQQIHDAALGLQENVRSLVKGSALVGER
ncbi:hypothetical protein ACPW96_01265 [Micromonospora sp. DT81.3]|uniref:hypothetical protein n=1 Tax=Actinomycetes TaxID=1760 RepID=UPI003CE93C04